jgi:hypothetical protein
MSPSAISPLNLTRKVPESGQGGATENKYKECDVSEREREVFKRTKLHFSVGFLTFNAFHV